MGKVTISDIQNFAERVERLCDFLLDDIEKNGTRDVVVLQKLKEDAANIQFIDHNSFIMTEGLADHILGVLKSR